MKRRHEIFTRNSVLLAATLLAIRLAAGSVAASQTPATSLPPVPQPTGVTAGYGPGYVSGIVTQKFTGGHDGGEYEIAVDGTPYDVPMTFWFFVHVGDAVRYTGTEWQIVKRSAGPAMRSHRSLQSARRPAVYQGTLDAVI